ncbi:hypothetical protein WJX84_002256 [Apatococcus fuscideae]|uniref:fructose-bisphosphate aldolase n=1 Tax=Apatococcus fuscideae TaxID=2026836 RepID=A0AAW1TI02_9CHLO
MDPGSSISQTAKYLCRAGYGILASDESTATMNKRLAKTGLDGSLETRRAYRELFYCADIGKYISGAILFKEMLVQKDSTSQPFTTCLVAQGVLPGIKADEGLEAIASGAKSKEETHTKGLDSLKEACQEYRRQGARFAKWRAALKISADTPSELAISMNAAELGKYARICQDCGLVPIVEPEILIDGEHGMRESSEAAERVLVACFQALREQAADLGGMLLKPQMIIPGSEFTGPKPSSRAIAEETLRVMRKCVPPEVPGIMFLSGGQTEVEATANLDAINRLASEQGGAPWALTFSYGRALQSSVLDIWSKDRSKVAEAQQMAAALAAANGAASVGQWDGQHPSVLSSSQSLLETFRGWNAQPALQAQ